MKFPINTAKQVANTITTRYEGGRAIDYYSGGAYPRTSVIVIYEAQIS